MEFVLDRQHVLADEGRRLVDEVGDGRVVGQVYRQRATPGTASRPSDRSVSTAVHHARPPPERQRRTLSPLCVLHQTAPCRLRRISSSAATSPSTLNQVDTPTHRSHRPRGVLGIPGGEVPGLDAGEHDLADHPLLPVPVPDRSACNRRRGCGSRADPDESLRLHVHVEPQQRLDDGVEAGDRLVPCLCGRPVRSA